MDKRKRKYYLVRDKSSSYHEQHKTEKLKKILYNIFCKCIRRKGGKK